MYALPDRDKTMNFSQIIQDSQIDIAINRNDIDGKNLKKMIPVPQSSMITDNLINSTIIKDHNSKIAYNNSHPKKTPQAEHDFTRHKEADKKKDKKGKNCTIF